MVNIIVEKQRASIGFNQQKNSKDLSEMNMDAFHEQFSPEFRSRLDNIILFDPIKSFLKILKLLALNLRIKSKLTLSNAVKKHFAEIVSTIITEQENFCG